MLEFLPVAFCSAGNYRADVHRVLKSLPRSRTQENRKTFNEEEKAFISRETRGLRRDLLFTFQDVLSCSTLGYMIKNMLHHLDSGIVIGQSSALEDDGDVVTFRDREDEGRS